MTLAFPIPLLGFCAHSGTGKTTLLTRLIPLLREADLRVAVVKHAHHRFEMDRPGKDSFALRHAGADQVVVASRERLALIKECLDPRDEPSLAEALGYLDPRITDLVLVEGFKHESFPKIEVCRPSLGKPLLHPQDPEIIAVVADAPVDLARALPLLDLNRPTQVRDFVLGHIRQHRKR